MHTKPACAKCGLFFQPTFNGCPMLECMPAGPGLSSEECGKKHAAAWKPYKLWIGDLWSCRGCGAEIVVGTLGDCISEHYELTFKKYLQAAEEHSGKRNRALVKIYDC